MKAISFAIVLFAGITCFSVGAWTPEPSPTLLVHTVQSRKPPEVVEHFVTLHSTMMLAGLLLAFAGLVGWIRSLPEADRVHPNWSRTV